MRIATRKRNAVSISLPSLLFFALLFSSLNSFAQTIFNFETGSSVTSPAGGWTNPGVGTYYRSTSTSALTLSDLAAACNGYTKYNGSGSSTVYFQPASDITAISVSGTGTGSNRTFSSISISTTIGGTYTTIASASGTGIINSGVCGTIAVTNIGTITAGTFIKIVLSGNINTTRFDLTLAAITTPSTQASNISFSNVAQTGMTLTWTRGNGSNVAVFVKNASGAITNPTDGSTYTANPVLGSGTQLGSSGYYCVYNGNGTTVDISGLTASNTYYVQAFEYNGTGVNTKYLTTTATNNPNNQATLALGADYRSAASGNWNSASTWETYNGSAWVAAASPPSSTDGAISIRSGHVVTVTANVTVDELTINSGGEIDVNSGVTLNVANGTGTDITLNGTVKNSGTFTLGASATMTVSSTGVYEDAQAATNGTVTLPAATWSTGSTCKITGIVGQAGGTPTDFTTLQGVNQTFSNFTIDLPNLIGKLVLTRNGASNFVVSGTLTINATGTSIYGVQLTSSGNQESVSAGSYVQNGGVVSIIHNSSNTTAKGFNVAGAFTLNGTSVFNISAYTTGSGVTTLSVGGNVTVAPGALLQRNTSLGTGGTTNMTFNGTASQSVTLVTAGTINYTINNSAGIVLGSDMTANGTLTFTAGNIITGANKVILASGVSTVGAGTNGWVAGNFQKAVAAGASTATFEIGDATGYRPVTVSFATVTTPGNLIAAVSQSAGDHPGIASSGLDAGKTVNRYYVLTNSGIIFDQYDVIFNFLAGDIDAGANTASFIIKKYSGATWSSTTVGTRTGTSTQATALTSFSDFAIGEASSPGSPPTVSVQPNSTNVCTATNASFTSASASLPAPTVAWERSTNGTLWVPIDGVLDGGIYSGFTTGTLTVTGATATVNGYQYRAVFTNVNGTVNSNAATLTVNPLSIGGTAAGTQTICSGSTPSNLTLSGNTGSVVKWQKASDLAFTTPVDIAASASTTLTGATIGALSATTYFRANVKSGACDDVNSSVVAITVDPVSVGGTASANQTICSGSTPSNLTLSGNTGSVVKWQKASDLAFTTPVDIAASASTTLTGATIGALSATTYFRAVVQSGVCASANSSVVTITVDPASAGGTASANQTICSGSTPSNLTLSGNTGSVVKWQRASDVAFTTPVDIAASASTTLTGATIGALSSTTYFRAVVQSGICASANSSVVTITVDPASIGGTASTSQTICSGSIPSNLTLSGNTGSVVKWQKASDVAFTTPVDIAASASTTLIGTTIGPVLATTYFRAVVQSGVCATANSSVVAITVDAASNAGSLNGDQTVCVGNAPNNIIATGTTGSVVRWESSPNASFAVASPISNTTTTLAPGTLTATTYYRVVVKSGSCAEAPSNTPVQVTVNTALQNSMVLAGTSGGASVCNSHNVSVSANYFNNCDIISTITPAGASPVTGNINTCVKLDASVNAGMPYVPRTYIVTAAAGTTANVTLYFTQADFNAFNAANGSFGDLPVNGSDATGKANMRISIFAAASHTPGSSGENLYDPVDANIVYNSAANRWEVTLPVTFAANNSFFVHTNRWPLPVSLTGFKGELNGAYNKLTWSTASESNNKGFEVERSADGKNFSSIGFVRSKAENGNSSSALDYQLNDEKPFAGNSYYRLKQVDKDGKFTYSNVILLGRKVNTLLLANVFPNPAARELNVIIQSPGVAKLNLVITDLSGRMVMQTSSVVVTGTNQQVINIEKLSAGTYVIKAICDDGCETAMQRFVKQ